MVNAAQLVIGVESGRCGFAGSSAHCATLAAAERPWALGRWGVRTVCRGPGLGHGAALGDAAAGAPRPAVTEMAITAKVLQPGVPRVTAFQACRPIVLMLVDLLYRRIHPRRHRRYGGLSY